MTAAAAELLLGKTAPPAFADLLRPEPLPDGAEAEERLVFCGVSWQRYLGLDQALGDDRPGPRFYYLDGDLEIMTTSNEHERIMKCIGGFLEIYFEETGLDVVPRGQATLRLANRDAGAEPDESWCLGADKEIPDLVLEIALTSGGVSKLEVYRRFKVAEVWLWRRDGLAVFAFDPRKDSYERVPRSRLLPALDLGLLERCVAMQSWREARRTFRAAIAAGD